MFTFSAGNVDLSAISMLFSFAIKKPRVNERKTVPFGAFPGSEVSN